MQYDRLPEESGRYFRYRKREDMKKRKSGILLALMISAALCAGCGRQNEEAVDACKTKYAQLVDEHNVVVGLYAKSESGEYDGRLEQLSAQVKEMGELDVGRMEVEELDALLEQMKGLMEEYEEIYADIEKTAGQAEETEYCQASVTLKNMTTVSFYEVYFYNAAKEETRVNLVTDDPETYNGLEVYNLVNLVMEKEQTIWRLEALDNEGNLIASGDIDLAPYDGTGVVVEMRYSFATNEGWLDLKRVGTEE